MRHAQNGEDLGKNPPQTGKKRGRFCVLVLPASSRTLTVSNVPETGRNVNISPEIQSGNRIHWNNLFWNDTSLFLIQKNDEFIHIGRGIGLTQPIPPRLAFFWRQKTLGISYGRIKLVLQQFADAFCCLRVARYPCWQELLLQFGGNGRWIPIDKVQEVP